MADLSVLLKAARSKNIGKIKKLVKEGIDINARDMNGTVLHYVVAEGREDMIEPLVKLGANVNAVGVDGKTPLHCVFLETTKNNLAKQTKKGHVKNRGKSLDVLIHKRVAEIIGTLVSLGGDINATFDDFTPLHRAVIAGDVQTVKRLIKKGDGMMNVSGKRQLTALTMAVLDGDISSIKCLVRLGADVNLSSSVSYPIHDAVESGRMYIVQILVQNGARVNRYKLGPFTPLLTIFNNICTNPKMVRLEVLECLLELGADADVLLSGRTAVHLAVETKQAAILKYLLTQGGDLSLPMEDATPLCRAVADGRHDLVECLVKYADVNKHDNRLEVPILLAAVREGEKELVEILVNNGARIEEEFYFQATALEFAVSSRNVGMVNILVQHNADVNMKYSGMTILHDAVQRGDLNMVDVLGNLGADMNVERNEKYTLLHRTFVDAKFDDDDSLFPLVKALVAAGSNVNACCNCGVKPLHDAVRLSNIKMVNKLVDLEADITGVMIVDTSPLHGAAQKYTITDNQIFTYLVKHGADINACAETLVGSVIDALHFVNAGMLRSLGRRSFGIRPILFAVDDCETVKWFIQNGADVNVFHTRVTGAVYEAQKNHSEQTVKIFENMEMRRHTASEKWSLLNSSVEVDNTETIEYLLTLRMKNQFDPQLPVSDKIADLEEEIIWMDIDTDRSPQGLGCSLLHQACRLGNTDLARLLIITGSDINFVDTQGKKPLDCLPLVDSVDYHVLYQAATNRSSESVPPNVQQTVCCPNMRSLHCILGIGDVQYISSPKYKEVAKPVCESLQTTVDRCPVLSGVTLKRVGSSAEGTRVGLPAEMDFLFQFSWKISEKTGIRDAGSGFCHYVDETRKELAGGSKSFHEMFKNAFVQELVQVLHLQRFWGKLSFGSESSNSGIKDAKRKACTTFHLEWIGEKSEFHISIDAVPCLHVSDWPKGGISKTWLMDYQELKTKGYSLVPKPPHQKTEFAKKFSKSELSALWRLSFAHLETEHMQCLEQRVKDVYITAKLLRNPDVCRIMVTDEGSLPRNVDRYLSSYLLKMVFFKNVEHFLSSDLSLGEMVCKVYDDLEDGLANGNILFYFMPKVNVLDGLKLDVPKSARAAKLMKRFVWAMYLRDIQNEPEHCDDVEVVMYQREPTAVYRLYEIGD